MDLLGAAHRQAAPTPSSPGDRFLDSVTIARRLWASSKKAGIERFARVADRYDPSIRPEEADAPERLTTRERVTCQRWDNAGEMDDSVFHRLGRSLRSAMWNRVYTVVTTLFTMLGLGGLLSLRFVGFYSHQALAIVLLLGFGLGGCEPGLGGVEGTPVSEAVARISSARESATAPPGGGSCELLGRRAAVACLAVFPRSAEMTPLIAGLAGVSVLRIAASFLVSGRTNAGPTLVMAVTAAVLLFDLGRGFIGSPAPIGAACGAVRGRVAGVTGRAEPPSEPPSHGLQPMVCPRSGPAGEQMDFHRRDG